MPYQSTLEFALSMDQNDPLKHFREKFHLPKNKQGEESLYFCGNSLGLQPKSAQDYVNQEMSDWAQFGVLGHHAAKHPWVKYEEFLTEYTAELVGAKPIEVVVMNSLTVNVNLMLYSFYNPTKQRFKIVMEYSPFPSDRYAVIAQIKQHGLNPDETLIELKPNPGEEYVSFSTIENVLADQGEQIALLLIGNVNYYTGQAYPVKAITDLGHKHGCIVGFDFAHGAGNLLLQLHDDGPDFAIWCSYKYLNAGPGGLSGCFIHERHAHNPEIHRMCGWWGHNKQRRFKMEPTMEILPGAEGWQLSNPPILPMACLMASLEIFHEAGMQRLREKSLTLSGYAMYLFDSLQHPDIRIITPRNDEERGAQISVQILTADKSIHRALEAANIISDWREPDVIRIAPVPLYNSYSDVYKLYTTIKTLLSV